MDRTMRGVDLFSAPFRCQLGSRRRKTLVHIRALAHARSHARHVHGRAVIRRVASVPRNPIEIAIVIVNVIGIETVIVTVTGNVIAIGTVVARPDHVHDRCPSTKRNRATIRVRSRAPVRRTASIARGKAALAIIDLLFALTLS